MQEPCMNLASWKLRGALMDDSTTFDHSLCADHVKAMSVELEEKVGWMSTTPILNNPYIICTWGHCYDPTT